jgi:hypothetical protein
MGPSPILRILLLLASSVFPSAFANSDPGKWIVRISPKLAYDPYRSDFHLDVAQPQALGTASAWDEISTLLPGLDIPQESLAFVPNIPISQLLMGDISMLERDFHGGSKHYPRSSAPFKAPELNYEPMSEVFSPHFSPHNLNLETGSRHTVEMMTVLLSSQNRNAVISSPSIDIFSRLHHTTERRNAFPRGPKAVGQLGRPPF